jgi:hypothetical protein
MSRKTLLVLAMVLMAGLAWAKPELGSDGRPLPPHLRHRQPRAQKQQPVNLRQQPGRPQMPGRPNGLDARKQEISRSLRTKPAQRGKAMPRPSIKGVVKDEFLVNDDTQGIGCYAGYQYEPKTALLPSGEMMVVWYDERNSCNYQVFGRCYDASGNPVGDDFLINDFTGAGAEYPAITASGNGFIVAWTDYRNGYDDIYAQRFGPTGTPIGNNFLVNDFSGECYYPSVAASDSGFIITWEDYRSDSYYDIYAQRYDASGSAAGGNFLVNDDGGSYDHCQYGGYNISASDSGFVITWYDYRDGDANIYAQRYDVSGSAVGSNFLVNDDSGSDDQYDPSVAASDSGLVFAWQDYRDGDANIYAQRYNAAGDTLGGNFLVTDDGGSYDQCDPIVAVSDSGFVITWYDYRSDNYYDIYAQQYDASGATVGGNFLVNDDGAGTCNHYSSSVAANNSGFVVSWYDERNNTGGYYDIFCQRYNMAGDTLGPNFMVNSGDTGTADQWDASTAMNTSGNSVVVWYDLRHDDGGWNIEDIYGQRYDPSGNPVGVNFIVNDTLSAARRYDYDPRAAFLPGGGFVVAWGGYDVSWNGDIYAQLFDSAGTPVGGNFKVSNGPSDEYCPDVAATDSGFLITWYDYRNGTADIYAQLYKTNGDSIGGNFRVDDGSDYQYNAKMAANGNGYLIAWNDSRNGNNDIYAQLLKANGDTIGGNFLVNDDGGSNSQYDPSVVMGDSGFAIAWYDYRYDGSHSDIYAQLYKVNGDTIGGNFVINDDAQGVAYHYSPSISLSPDGHNLVIAWEDYRNDPSGYLAEIIAQKYVDGVAVGGNAVVNGTALANRYFWGGHRIACTNLLVLFNWDDNRRFKGGDIYAKLTDWDLQHIEAVPPVISYVDSLGDDISADYGPYDIKAVVADNQALQEVKLLYQINGGTTDTLEMSFVAADTFVAAIPAQVLSAYDTVTVGYLVTARDSSGNSATSKAYSFRAIELTGITGQTSTIIPGSFALQPAYPNPAHGQTVIKYQLPKASSVKLQVYNITGQLVKTFDEGHRLAGYHQIGLSTQAMPNGIYFYRLTAGEFSATEKFMVVR